jgi:ABC-type nitrate/sulfonate/bicarbonate transport system permease component
MSELAHGFFLGLAAGLLIAVAIFLYQFDRSLKEIKLP